MEAALRRPGRDGRDRRRRRQGRRTGERRASARVTLASRDRGTIRAPGRGRKPRRACHGAGVHGCTTRWSCMAAIRWTPICSGAWRMKAATILLGACLLACTSHDPAVTGPGDPPAGPGEMPVDTAFPNRCADSACATGPTVAAAKDLISIVEASSWVRFGPYTTGCLPASPDIHVTGSVTVQGDGIAIPAFCQSRQDCRKAVRFRSRPLPAGVECIDPEPWYEYTLCGSITLRDTTIRLRTVDQDIHPSEYGNSAPVVDVLAACAAPCGSSEFACEATHTCWSEARDQCAYCLSGTNEACACWNGTGFDKDGARCTFAISGDVYLGGTCRAGTCIRNP